MGEKNEQKQNDAIDRTFRVLFFFFVEKNVFSLRWHPMKYEFGLTKCHCHTNSVHSVHSVYVVSNSMDICTCFFSCMMAKSSGHFESLVYFRYLTEEHISFKTYHFFIYVDILRFCFFHLLHFVLSCFWFNLSISSFCMQLFSCWVLVGLHFALSIILLFVFFSFTLLK